MAEAGDLTYLKSILDLEGEEEDALLGFILDQVAEAIKNYCRIDAIPEELRYARIAMARDAFNAHGTGNLKSIREGEVSMSFGGADFLRGYTAELSRFRRAGW